MRVVHVSDLHLISDLAAPSSVFRSRASFARSHSPQALAALSANVQRLKPNMIVVTGDLTTDGSESAMRTAARYVTRDNVNTSYPTAFARTRGRTSQPIRGMGAGDRAAIVVGNHDRYWYGPFGQIQRTSYEQVFRTLPYTRILSEPTLNGERTLVLVGLDSTLHDRRLWPSIERLAEGEVSTESLEYVNSVSEQIAQGAVSCSYTNQDYPVGGRNTVALVVLLHHHPVLPRGTQEDSPSWLSRLMEWSRIRDYKLRACRLRNAAEVCQALEESRVDVVMFGHQHMCYREFRSNTLYSGCPASASWRAIPKKNWDDQGVRADSEPGFLHYDFGDLPSGFGLKEIAFHRWEEDRFVEHNLRMSHARGDDAASGKAENPPARGGLPFGIENIRL